MSGSSSRHDITPGTLYRHYKGGLYKVVFAGTIMGTEGDSDGVPAERVLYESMYDSDDFPKGTVWRRTLSKFQELVLVDGRQVPRFERVEQERPPITVQGVRYGQQDDTPVLLRILRVVCEEHRLADPDQYELSLPDLDDLDLQHDMDRHLSGQGMYILTSCDSAGTPRAFVLCEIAERQADGLTSPGWTLHVHVMAADPQERSHGHGTKLLRAADELAAQFGADQIRLRVWVHNERAQAFYQRYGFRTMRHEMILRPKPLEPITDH
jgi:ribosomal protein S18 acetylase RimI-like enzyme